MHMVECVLRYYNHQPSKYDILRRLFSQHNVWALFAQDACKQNNVKQVERREALLKNKQEKAAFLPFLIRQLYNPASPRTVKWQGTYCVGFQLALEQWVCPLSNGFDLSNQTLSVTWTFLFILQIWY